MITLPLRLQSLAAFVPWRPPSDSRMLLVGGMMAVVVSISVFSTLSVVASRCGAGESLLVYPRYSRKGIVEEYTEMCGQPHKSCIQRVSGMQPATYDCSPFVLDRVSLSWQ